MDKFVYDAISKFAREIVWVEITLKLYVKQSSIVDKNMFLM
mgnify:FL=1